MILTDASGQKWVSLEAYDLLKQENDILKHNLKETVGILDSLKKTVEMTLRTIGKVDENNDIYRSNEN